jgi:hypothetical protein
MSVRKKIVPPATTSTVLDPTPLQLCLAAAAKDDEIAMEILGRFTRSVYIRLRRRKLDALEREYGEQLSWGPDDTLASLRREWRVS